MLKHSGIVKIGEEEVGIVYKRIAPEKGYLPSNRKIALDGETGYQADTLPPGIHFGYFFWEYKIHKVPVIKVPLSEIALVIAEDGAPIPSNRILGKEVECDNFQDARAFLIKSGEKGRQMGILTTGTYRINTALFTVITSGNAAEHGINPEDLREYKVEEEKIGIVYTEDGTPLPEGDIAGKIIPGHDNFQNGQKFIDGGGYKGLQEEVLKTGTWKLNPWFVRVEQVPLINIPNGTVGVVISNIGKTPPNKPPYNPVPRGYKGVCEIPLYPGKYPINIKINNVEIVPTHDITLEWSNKAKPPTNYDANLNALRLRSKDGFLFELEVTQVISIAAKDAPKMISRVGTRVTYVLYTPTGNNSELVSFSSIRNLVLRVLEPMIGNYFRNSAQYRDALEFLHYRSEQQREAADYIKSALGEYGVQTVGTFVNEIDLPDDLEKILNQRTIAELQTETYKQEQLAEIERTKLSYQKALSEIQKDLVKFEQGVRIAELKALAQKYETQTKVEETRELGKAQAEIMQAIVNVYGREGYVDIEKIKQLVKLKLPEFWINNSDGSNSGTMEALIYTMLGRGNQQSPISPNFNITTPERAKTQTQKSRQLESGLSKEVEPYCPIVLLLDTSSAVSDEYIHKLNAGLVTFKQEVGRDYMARKRVEVAVVTFNNSAETVRDFVSIAEFEPPRLKGSGTTSMGKGLELALNEIQSRKAIYSKHNIEHRKPWLFLIIGSPATDNWHDAVLRVRYEVDAKELNFFVVYVSGADTISIKEIAHPMNSPVMLDGLKFRELFWWIADSMKKVAGSWVDGSIQLASIAGWARVN